MNNVTPSTSSFLPQSIGWTPAIGGAAALITGAFLTPYFLKNVFTSDSKDIPGLSDHSRQVAPVSTGSKWVYLNPLTLIAAIANKLFFVISYLLPRVCTEGSPKADYQKIVNLHNPASHLFEIARRHPGRNRFSNILPNEPTRFKLDHDPNFYFNANWVLNKTAIACQGPLENEIDEFWQMAWHADVESIVMLANPIEVGRNKCSEYWKAGFFSSVSKNIGVSCKSEKIIFEKENVKIVERAIELKKGNERRTITQYHLQNWPDFGVVKPEVLAQLIKTISSKKGNKPLIVHCSAGVGRTGTFLAAFQAFKEKTNSIFPIVSNLRNPHKGRVGLIQTAEQYALARDTATLLFKK